MGPGTWLCPMQTRVSLSSFPKGRTKALLTQGFPDQIELIHIRFSWPQRHPWQQLSKDTANCPNIYWGAVLRVSHQQLWGAVPPGCHIVCVVVTRSSWPVMGHRKQSSGSVGSKPGWGRPQSSSLPLSCGLPQSVVLNTGCTLKSLGI